MRSTSASDVEPPFLSYLGNSVTINSISISAISNVRADVYNSTVPFTVDYTYPTVEQVKTSVPARVPRYEAFTLTFGSLVNATEYAISLYSEDLKQVPTEQTIASTTFFITTDSVRCLASGEWPLTTGGSYATRPCERGYSGARLRWCDWEGDWGEETANCSRGGGGV